MWEMSYRRNLVALDHSLVVSVSPSIFMGHRKCWKIGIYVLHFLWVLTKWTQSDVFFQWDSRVKRPSHSFPVSSSLILTWLSIIHILIHYSPSSSGRYYGIQHWSETLKIVSWRIYWFKKNNKSKVAKCSHKFSFKLFLRAYFFISMMVLLMLLYIHICLETEMEKALEPILLPERDSNRLFWNNWSESLNPAWNTPLRHMHVCENIINSRCTWEESCAST